jgi:hypothetical protein
MSKLPLRFIQYEVCIFQSEESDFILGTTPRMIDMDDVAHVEQYVDHSRVTREDFTVLYFYSHTTPDLYIVVNEKYRDVVASYYDYKQYWYERVEDNGGGAGKYFKLNNN